MENGQLTSVMYPELAKVTVDSLMNIDGKTWDDGILGELCNDRDRELLYQIPIPLRGKPDSWFWLPDTKGGFKVRSCYRLLRGESVSQEREVWSRLWRLKLPVWESTGLQSLVLTGDVETIKETIKRVFQTATKDQCALFGMFCWGIWVRRNKWVWKKISMSVFGIKHMAMNLLSNWNRARAQDARIQNRHVVHQRTWCKPSTGWVKVNIDAACYPGCDFVAVGCVVRDACGLFLPARSNIIRWARSPREAEAMSLREALSWVKNWRVNNCVFELDSKLLIDALDGPDGSSLFHTIVEDCRELAKHYENVLFEFVPRSANSVAHEITRAAYSSTGLKEWYDTAPDFILCNLLMDEY